MGSEKSSTPDWVDQPPAVFDVVTGFFPETKPENGRPKLRPLLVTRSLQNRRTGEFACEVCYGTTKLKTWAKLLDDVIIQNISDLDEIGLAVATRFVVNPAQRAIIPWNETYFGCWTGQRTPRLGALPLEYQKDFAFAMMRWSADD